MTHPIARGDAAGESASRDDRLRLALAAALAAAAGSHLPVLSEHLHEAPWMGWLFVAFVAAALGAAALTLVLRARWVLTACMALTAAAVATYVASRLWALPQLADDVGDWFDPWGTASIVGDLAALLIAVGLRRRSGQRSPGSVHEQPPLHPGFSTPP